MSFLENLSYVDENGLVFVGKKTLIETISNCLKRTGLEQDIRADVAIIYTGLGANDVLANAKLDQTRFLKNDGDTIMSCSEVLTSVLEIFGAVLINMENIWYIYKPNQLALDSEVTFYQYDFDGVVHTTPTVTLDFAFTIGNDIDDDVVHHCSGNQSISNEKSLGGFRTNYKYGFVKGILENPNLDSNGTVVFDWTIDDATNLALHSTRGVFLTSFDIDTSSLKNMTCDSVPLLANDVVEFVIKFKTTSSTLPNPPKQEIMPYRIKVVGASTLYYNSLTNIWAVGSFSNKIVVGQQDVVTTTFKTLTIPIDGDVSIELWTPYGYLSSDPVSYDPNFEIYVTEVSLTTIDDGADIKGEFHTFTRTSNPNSKIIKDVKEVFNGDNLSAIYLGTIYKFNETDLTETWNRVGISETLALLQIMGEETMRLNGSTKRVFTGDVFGFFNFLSVITLTGLDGKYLLTDYSYDTKSNIIRSGFKQIFGDELADIDYVKTLDRGNVVTPTIIG